MTYSSQNVKTKWSNYKIKNWHPPKNFNSVQRKKIMVRCLIPTKLYDTIVTSILRTIRVEHMPNIVIKFKFEKCIVINLFFCNNSKLTWRIFICKLKRYTQRKSRSVSLLPPCSFSSTLLSISSTSLSVLSPMTLFWSWSSSSFGSKATSSGK